MGREINKVIYINIFFVIIGLLIINIFSVNAFYENYLGKNFYELKDYSGSILKFEKSGNINGVYNKANSLYKQKKYGEAIKEYKSILGKEKNELNFRLNHNIGNSFYRIGELDKDSDIKIKNWQESVKFYTDALNIKYDEETKKNLEFVLKKIKEEKSKEKNKDKKQNKSDKQNKENKQDKQNKTGTGASQENKQDKQSKTGTGASQENKQDKQSKTGTGASQEKQNNSENKISKEQKQALKQYEKALKKEQKNNADSFNKVYKEDNSNDFFDNFFNDPFFNNDLLNNKNEKKDW